MPEPQQVQQENIDTWKQALWDFILEHCEVTENGALFVKFHTSGRSDLEKRIRARWKYGYHREDVRAKEAGKDQRQEVHTTEKQKKYETWKANKDERRRVMDELKRQNERNIRRRRMWSWLRIFGVKID